MARCSCSTTRPRTILQASANAGAFLQLGPAALAGRTLASLPGTLAARVRAQLDEPLHRRPVAIRARIGEPAREVDALVHRPADGGVVVELEPASASIAVRERLDEAAQKILAAASLRALCDETAALFKELTGYDRVMVYRFDELGHGEVFSERREPEREAFLGNRYPASDIPQIARRLYLETRVRLLVDVEAEAVPILPRQSPDHGRELDMSLCALRSMSPVHLQYLKNMGVRATLVLSLVVGGELWGLVACHHYAPRTVGFQERALGELIAELVATRIAALESFVQTQSELVVRRLEQRMIEAIGRDGDWRAALFDGSGTLLQSVGATGAALVYESQVQVTGEVPATARIRDIVAWLDAQPREPVVATATLGARRAAPRGAGRRRDRDRRDADLGGAGRIPRLVPAPSASIPSSGAATRASPSWSARTRASCRRGCRSRNGTSASRARRIRGPAAICRWRDSSAPPSPTWCCSSVRCAC